MFESIAHGPVESKEAAQAIYPMDGVRVWAAARR